VKHVLYDGHAVLTVPYSLSAKSKPGQCAKINGAWFAIAEQRSQEFDVIVKSTSPLLQLEETLLVEGPTGPGFQNAACSHAIVVAGGTGLGAVISLLKYRGERGLTSDLIYFSKDMQIAQVVPPVYCKNVILWNTVEKTRPDQPLVLPEIPKDSQVFVSGPKSLVEACKAAAQVSNLTCNLNF